MFCTYSELSVGLTVVRTLHLIYFFCILSFALSGVLLVIVCADTGPNTLLCEEVQRGIA